MEETAGITQKQVMRKVVTRLMPALLILYVIAYLDRVNVTFAQERLEEDLGFSGAVYGFGAGIFFIGYFLLEVPSNLALHRFGARKWMARIMITWGLISACTMFVTSPLSFYAVRFLLGIAEAGFFPGMILYLSLLVPRPRAGARGRRLHERDRDLLRDRRADQRRDHGRLRRRRGPRGLAVAVPDRGDPGDRRRRRSSSSSCPTARRTPAGSRRTRSAGCCDRSTARSSSARRARRTRWAR